MSGRLGMLIALLFYKSTFSLLEIQRIKNRDSYFFSFFCKKVNLKLCFFLFFAALDDVPFAISEKFYAKPQEVKVVGSSDKKHQCSFNNNNMRTVVILDA